MSDIIVLDSPTIEMGAPLYQVTLENGAVLTRPSEFAPAPYEAPLSIFSEQGYALTARR